MAELAEAYPDQEWLKPAEQDWIGGEPWHALYWDAWAALRYDRPYGAFGGEGAIPYRAYRDYAFDHGIAGDDFRLFHRFMTMLDDEWLAHVAEQEKLKAGKA